MKTSLKKIVKNSSVTLEKSSLQAYNLCHAASPLSLPVCTLGNTSPVFSQQSTKIMLWHLLLTPRVALFRTATYQTYCKRPFVHRVFDGFLSNL